MKCKSILICSVAWFTALAVTVVSSAGIDVHEGVDPLLNSGSLVVAALLLLIGVLLIAVTALWKEGKANTKERQDLALRTLQVLSDLDKTIEANTNARVRVGG